MSKRMVRIYKDPNHQGSYVNKTKAFLEKAQAGAQVDQKKMIDSYMQSIYQKLKSEEEIEDVFTELVASGMSEAIAEKLLSAVVDQMVAAGELNTDNAISEKQAEEEAAQLEKEKAEKESAEQQQQEQEEEEEQPDQAMDYFNSYGSEDDSYQSDEYQDGGSIEDSEDTPDYSYLEKPDTVVPTLNNYYESAFPLSFNEEPEYKRGGSKKSFVKNVLKRLQEGGEGQEQALGQGNKFDTADDEVSKRKNNFMNLIKEQANKAKIDELYDKMMQSNNPELLEIAKTFSNDNPVPEDDTMTQGFQSGGYVGGESQPEMFMYGGTELPFYEADFLPEARYGYSVGNLRKAQNGDNGKLTEEELKQAKELNINDPGFSPSGTRRRIDESRRNKWIDEQMQSKSNPTEKNNKTSNDKRTYIGTPYNARTREAYTDSFEGLNPYAKTVHKRGIFGRPKQWTEYYSKGSGPGKTLTPGQEIKAAYEKQMAEGPAKLKHGVEKDVWDDLSGKAKREIRRGERQLGREARRGADSMKEDAAFNKGVHAQYKYNSEEDLARDQKRSEDAWNSKEKEFVSDLDNSVKSPYKDLVYNQDGDVVALPELLPAGYTDVKFEMPDRPLQEDETSDKNMLEATRARDEAIEEKRLYDQMVKEEALAKEEMELDAERELMAPSAKIEADAQKRLSDFYKNQRKEFKPIMSDKIRKDFQFENLKHFIPDKSRNMEDVRASYDKGLFEEPDREMTADEIQSRMQVEDRMNSGFGFRYGGLPKAQTGPPVKKPSDPSTNTTDLSGMLKPASNPNTLMGATQSFPGAPSAPINPDAGKVKTVQMDPNQTKGQTITSEDFGDPKNDDLIAIDKQRAPMNFDGESAVNKFNAGATAITGFLNNLDTAKQQKEMYDNNFTSDNMYAATNTRDRGDYVDYGQQLGQFRYDQMGSDTSGRFAYGQSGGYMQDGGFAEDDVVEMTEEELQEFLDNGGEVEYL